MTWIASVLTVPPTRRGKKGQLSKALFGNYEQSQLTQWSGDSSRRLWLSRRNSISAEPADRLYMSAPSLSELMRRLEIELGTPLFTRSTRRVAMTPAGAELLPRARSILEELKAARSAVRQVAGGESGVVRLDITPPVGPVLAPHLITAFGAEAP